MTEIQYGLKLWSTNAHLLPDAEKSVKEGVFHYVELTPIPGTQIGLFSAYDLPYVIHATTERDGVNIADPSKNRYNQERIGECIRWADVLGAKKIIIHPGFGRSEDAKKFLGGIDDPRIIIENMPMKGLGGERMIGYTAEQLQELSGGRFGFCLDFGHAIKASASLRKPYAEHIEELLALKPSIFHISDGFLGREEDEHLEIGAGEYDLAFLMECVRKNRDRRITLETPRKNHNSIDDDIKNLKRLEKIR